MDSAQQVSRELSDRQDKELLARVEDLTLHFDTKNGTVQALDGVSFDIFEEETVALVGETGCGKSVTARSFIQLVETPPGRYPNGSIWLKSNRTCDACGGSGCETCHGTGKAFDDLLAMNPREMHDIRSDRIAMIFQDPGEALNPSLTIKNQVAESVLINHQEEILEEAGVPAGKSNQVMRWALKKHASPDQSTVQSALASAPPIRKYKKRIDEIVRDRVVDILRRTQIANPEEVANKYPHELSGGMQQRVMIATALVAEPDLLIADEPTTALDVTIQTRILDLMSELQEEFNTSFLYITHDLSLVENIADRVVVMYAGSIAEVAEVEDLYSNPSHPYTHGLIDSIPTEDRVGGELRGIEGSIPDLLNPPEGCRFCTRCPDVLDHCNAVDPETVEIEPDHYVSCHLYTTEGAETPGKRDPAFTEDEQ